MSIHRGCYFPKLVRLSSVVYAADSHQASEAASVALPNFAELE